MEAENRYLKRMLDGIIKGLLALLLGIGVILFTTIPEQKTRNFYYYARLMGVIVVSQLTRLFGEQYAESEKWREKVSNYVKMWNDITAAIHSGIGQSSQHRRKNDE